MKYALTTSLVVALTLAAAAINVGVTVIAAPSCENLKALTLPNTTITFAQTAAQGAFMAPVPADGAAVPPAAGQALRELPAFCRVMAALKPTSDSDIKIEVWLPVSGWNGKLLAVGNGGWAGVIGYPALGAALAQGYATAATDTGHVGNTADFALGHPEKLIDFGHRSIHEMTVQAKAIVQAYYGTGPTLSYFSGCSTGGRQAITEAQRYPADFNGIVAGASAWNAMQMHAARTAVNIMVNKEADFVIPPSKYPMIHNAVLEACDTLDGVKDGVIENPTRCHFDYAMLACKGADGTNCLTKGQVESAKVMTSPLKDPKNGRVLYEGHLWPGSELGWATLGSPAGYGNATTAMKNVAFKDPTWDYHRFDVSTEMERASRSDEGVLYSGDPNLKPFFDRGGKLLMYQGWADPQVTPQASVIYFDSVVKTVGHDKAAHSIALFMVPGMNHCQGGIGTDTFDKVGTLEQWVEQGKTPTTIFASHLTDGHVDRTRPLCPYPQVAEYKGMGSTDDAGNFSCKMR